jgi:hypothetical protein
MEDHPVDTQVKVKHYKHLLALYSARESRGEVIKLLGEDEARRPGAEASDKIGSGRKPLFRS